MPEAVPPAPLPAPRIVRVLIVDDSAYVRKVVREILARSPFIDVVGSAHDGADALEQVERLRPDVVTTDLIMPDMDGVAFIREQMVRRPVPIVVLSIAAETGDHALAALDAGAIDFVHKPTALATDKMLEISAELVEKVKAAAAAPLGRIAMRRERPSSPLPTPAVRSGRYDLVVIGVSTGGPQALKSLIPRLPADFPVPIVIVVHMPVGYTRLYARRLDDESSLAVKEADEGDELVPGAILIAPAGRHLTLRREGDGRVVAHLDVRPADTAHRPSVDVLFQSAAEVCGERVLGLVMTGMGSDGREGAAWIKAKGGRVLTEAEETCVVYGMPRAVVEAGLSDEAVPLDRMAAALVEAV